MDIYVNKDGTKDFSSLTECFNNLDNIKGHINVYLAPGIYEERPNLKRSDLSLIGEKDKETRITASEYALNIHEDGRKVGTFRTATFMADCDDFVAENIIFENAAGQGSKVGQAVALYADGQRQKYINCKFFGYQDTIFTAPLPPCEIEINGFLGEKQFMPRRDSLLYFENCKIEGNIDYIFGGAESYFDNCVIFTRKREKEGPCYVTAASTPEGNKTGYIFNNCRFESDAKKGTVYLGRPWRNFAKTVIKNSYIGDFLAEGAWGDWGKKEAHKTMYYAEEANYGPGALIKREDFVHILNQSEKSKSSKQ